jgi:hypothetical protein
MAANKQHFFNMYLIWINCNTKESGVELRVNILSLYGAVVDKALNIDKVQTIKSDFGLQFYQPDARIVSDIMYRFLNTQKSVYRTQALSADECEDAGSIGLATTTDTSARPFFEESGATDI